jgi:hypothetical protein
LESRVYRKIVMPGLVPGIHVLCGIGKKGVDGRDNRSMGTKQSIMALMNTCAVMLTLTRQSAVSAS